MRLHVRRPRQLPRSGRGRPNTEANRAAPNPANGPRYTHARASVHTRARTHTHTRCVVFVCVCVCIGPRIVGGRVGGPGGQERQRQCGVRCVSASLSSVSGELIVSGELMAGKKFGQTFSKVNILVHVCWKTTLCRLFFPHEFLPRGELRFYYLTKNNLNQINPN